MRWVLAVGLVVLLAGCTSEAPVSSPSSTPTSASPLKPAGGNSDAVCAAAQNASGQAVGTYISELGNMLAASGKGDTKAADAARSKAEAALDGWSTAMKEQSAKAEDPQLKAVLAEIGAEVDKMGADIDSVNEAQLGDLQERLDRLCTP
ncbi:hypothetical protein K1W54_36215 [Micromonospora sp. CPCC 205371]|nr:hypothetical protein [Micromonospora sp. CPCC 205371]